MERVLKQTNALSVSSALQSPIIWSENGLKWAEMPVQRALGLVREACGQLSTQYERFRKARQEAKLDELGEQDNHFSM